MELVQPDQVGPACGQGGGVGVRGGDRGQLGCAEQVQHGQVGQPVTAVGRRVDEHHTGRGEDHVPGPQVAVQAGRWAVVVELTRPEALADVSTRARPRGLRFRWQLRPRRTAAAAGRRRRCPKLGGTQRQGWVPM